MADGLPCRCGRGTLYDVLQVSPWCEPEVIQAAFRALARTRHPDLNHDPDAEDQMRRLNVAYQTLSDPVRRARYDEELALESARQAPARPAPAAGASVTSSSSSYDDYAEPPRPRQQTPRAAAHAATQSAAYQTMMFDQRGEGMLSRSALYLVVVLVTVIMALVVYIMLDFLATERPLAPRGPRSQLERSLPASAVPGAWLLDGPDGGGPGLSPAGERWNR
ncbi:MAG: J domain-containing protein [Chloroflexi bacterium]|nr:J domain-containing protein [Chloroflexota bacterium]